MAAKVYIAQSLDGYIADKNGGLGFLDRIPHTPDTMEAFTTFVDSVDAIVMGRTTYETVIGFNIPWPYTKKVFVLSSQDRTVDQEYEGKAEYITGKPSEIIKRLETDGYKDLYIDGGRTIQSFLHEDMVDDLIIATIPTLLGGGSPLFGALDQEQHYKLIESKTLADSFIQTHYQKVTLE